MSGVKWMNGNRGAYRVVRNEKNCLYNFSKEKLRFRR